MAEDMKNETVDIVSGGIELNLAPVCNMEVIFPTLPNKERS
jgi:hypothetical protein